MFDETRRSSRRFLSFENSIAWRRREKSFSFSFSFPLLRRFFVRRKKMFERESTTSTCIWSHRGRWWLYLLKRKREKNANIHYHQTRRRRRETTTTTPPATTTTTSFSVNVRHSNSDMSSSDESQCYISPNLSALRLPSTYRQSETKKKKIPSRKRSSDTNQHIRQLNQTMVKKSSRHFFFSFPRSNDTHFLFLSDLFLLDGDRTTMSSQINRWSETWSLHSCTLVWSGFSPQTPSIFSLLR